MAKNEHIATIRMSNSEEAVDTTSLYAFFNRFIDHPRIVAYINVLLVKPSASVSFKEFDDLVNYTMFRIDFQNGQRISAISRLSYANLMVTKLEK